MVMLRVVVLGYGEMACSLMLGIIDSGHELVAYMPWEFNSSKTLVQKIFPFLFKDELSTIALKYKIPRIKADLANEDSFKQQLRELNPDLVIIGSWGEILKKDVIDIPKLATVNCHPSLLPKHRGANPYASVLKMGENYTGITFHIVDEGIDTGKILFQARLKISENDTSEELRKKCSYIAKITLKDVLDDFEKGLIIPISQDNSQATYYERLNINDTYIDWNNSACAIHNQIRAITPWLYGYAEHKGNILMLRKTKVVKVDKGNNKPGAVLFKSLNSIVIATGDEDKAIEFSEVWLYGKIKKFLSPFYFKFFINEGDLFYKLN